MPLLRLHDIVDENGRTPREARPSGERLSYTAAGPCSPVRMRITSSNGTGASSVADDVDNAIDVLIGADKGELHFRDRVDKQFVAAHVFLPAMLCTAALNLVDSHTANISSKQRVFKNLKLLGTNNRRNLFHNEFLSLSNK